MILFNLRGNLRGSLNIWDLSSRDFLLEKLRKERRDKRGIFGDLKTHE